MSGMLRLLDRGYTMMWREGRVEEALIGLGDLHLDWELEEVAPGLALASIYMRGVGRESGVPTEMTFGQLWTYRDGRFVRMVMYYDADEARLGARVE